MNETVLPQPGAQTLIEAIMQTPRIVLVAALLAIWLGGMILIYGRFSPWRYNR